MQKRKIKSQSLTQICAFSLDLLVLSERMPRPITGIVKPVTRFATGSVAIRSQVAIQQNCWLFVKSPSPVCSDTLPSGEVNTALLETTSLELGRDRASRDRRYCTTHGAPSRSQLKANQTNPVPFQEKQAGFSLSLDMSTARIFRQKIMEDLMFSSFYKNIQAY